MDIVILELVSNRLTVPLKIDGRQEQEENIGAILTHAREYSPRRAHARGRGRISCYVTKAPYMAGVCTCTYV